MEFYYQGTEITDFVQIRKCVVHDTCGKRCDSLDMELEDAESWYRWGVQKDDEIQVIHRGCDSGVMYLHSVVPEDGKYRLIAAALPCRGRNRQYRSFRNKTIEEILRECALTTGMDYSLFGLDGGTVIPYIQQTDESSAAFLCRLLMLEGAKLKCVNGRYTAIGLAYAQGLSVQRTVDIISEQSGVRFLRTGVKTKTLTLETPYAKATAEDLAVENDYIQYRPGGEYPVMNAAQAGRWARGLLLEKNRECETLSLDTELDNGFSALVRFDVTGGTDADGAWLVEEAEHDLIRETSRAELRRCITTIQ